MFLLKILFLCFLVNSEMDASGEAVEVDPYEYLDPVDILSQLPKTFYTQLEAKKWSERKEALEVLEKLLSAAPKIESADYLELVKTLKKVSVLCNYCPDIREPHSIWTNLLNRVYIFQLWTLSLDNLQL